MSFSQNTWHREREKVPCNFLVDRFASKKSFDRLICFKSRSRISVSYGEQLSGISTFIPFGSFLWGLSNICLLSQIKPCVRQDCLAILLVTRSSIICTIIITHISSRLTRYAPALIALSLHIYYTPPVLLPAPVSSSPPPAPVFPPCFPCFGATW